MPVRIKVNFYSSQGTFIPVTSFSQIGPLIALWFKNLLKLHPLGPTKLRFKNLPKPQPPGLTKLRIYRR